jgi:hypothetical protein
MKISDQELKARVEAAIEEIGDEWDRDVNYVGIRFENAERRVGDIIQGCSKDNPDRTDDREFPDFGTVEYEKLDELDGISCTDTDDERYEYVLFGYGGNYAAEHCYLIGGDTATEGPDDYELVITAPKVLAVIA